MKKRLIDNIRNGEEMNRFAFPAVAIIAFLLCAMPALSSICIDSSTLMENFTSNGTAINLTFTCADGCVNNRCAGSSEQVDMQAMWIVYTGGTVFLILGTILGIPFGKLVGKEDIGGKFDTTMVVRYMFFFVGFYLTYMAFGMARGLEYAYGGAPNMAGGMDTATMVMMISMVLFLFVFVIETFFTVVQFLGNANEKGRFENE